MHKNIVVLPGDGIGPEVTKEALKVLQEVGKKMGMEFDIHEFPIGGVSLGTYGVPIQDEVVKACKESDAVFLGAVGGPKWDHLPKDMRPEMGLLRLRKELGLFTNFRPIKVFDALIDASTLKAEIVRGIDILVVRELTGGIYFGQPKFIEAFGNEEKAVDTMEYRTSEIERIARVAFDAAQNRKKKVISVDKANILVCSQLWRKTVNKMISKYPDIQLEHMLVDNCAMQLVRNPRQFDVLLTGNMFGDILSDAAAMISGSLGMMPSASLGKGGIGLYEPVHGSAPDIAGQGLANPLASINSIALMFRHSFHLESAAQAIEKSVENVLNDGYRSADLVSKRSKIIGTAEMGDQVVKNVNMVLKHL